uniref:CARD domain-containing protein n=1 Tax=Sparus aurata TaxID=8175 RepID=A0A671Y640_SPAAU
MFTNNRCYSNSSCIFVSLGTPTNIYLLLYSDEHFVDKHQSDLIKRVSNIQPILDELLRQNVIQQESYDKIKTLPTAGEKIRELISGPLKSSGVQGKDIFYEILIENEPRLIQDLKRMDAEVSKSWLHKSL